MMDTNMFINSISDNDISLLLKLLEDIGCSQSEIKNIIITNPFYFNQNINSIKKLFDYLKKINISSITTLLDSNPYLLNLSSKDINHIIEKMKKEGADEIFILNYLQYEYLV